MKRYIEVIVLLSFLLSFQKVGAYEQQATFTPADPYYGDYVGVMQMGDVEYASRAMVVAEKHQDREFHYRVQIIESGGERRTIVELFGKPGNDCVTLAGERDGKWTGAVKDGVIFAERKGDRPATFHGKFTRRKSPTEGLKPSKGATVLLPYKTGVKTNLDKWQNKKWKVLDDGSVEIANGGNVSLCDFGAVRMHVEFAVPYKCYDFGQGRCNSGVYLLGRYEVQVLDTYGFNTEPSNCGGIYNNIGASVEHVCFPPTYWQTYDIVFYPAKFGHAGKRIRPARITVFHNGTKIHENVEIEKAPTPSSIASDEAPRGPLHLQDHSNPVRYRNIWYVPIEDTRSMPKSGDRHDISDDWRLWLDEKAEWMDDELYLPDEAEDVSKLPVNPPTDGWDVLGDSAGISVNLPTTVEEHYWEKKLRPFIHDQQNSGYTEVVNNGEHNRCGAYRGVSWWWRKLDTPALGKGQRLIINFRGARYRTEIFVNEKLVGYNLIHSVPFSADITGAVNKTGQNVLALRITNPGGNFDWYDWITSVWGSKKNPIPLSHGFGGLDAGIEMLVRDDTYIEDLAVLNRKRIEDIRLIAEIKSVKSPYSGAVEFNVQDVNGRTVWKGNKPVSIQPGQVKIVEWDITVNVVEAWNLDNPNLYTAHAKLKGLEESGFQRSFGFRTVTLEGIGEDAMLRLNGKRIVLKSMISWGYWGTNGLYPELQFARKEVAAAKAFGLNCINFHRNIGKTWVMDEMDRQGLLAFEEPGGGGNAYDNDSLNARIEKELIYRMAKRDRSHPSLFMYNMCNELGISMSDDFDREFFRKLKSIDPSRIVTSISGINLDPPYTNNPDNYYDRPQSMMRPWDDTIYVGNFKDDCAGWYDEHTVNGAGVYLDTIYNGPDDFWHKARTKENIQAWGEMAGFGSPDNHQQAVKWFDDNNRSGYMKRDAKILLKAYQEFLKKYNFTEVFSSPQELFHAAANKSYSSWKTVMEVARLSDENDVLIGNGWDSTNYDNHSGLVDGLRNFKGDPGIMKKGLEPLMLSIMPRRFIVNRSGTSKIDIYILNEKNLNGEYTLSVAAKTPSGKKIDSFKKKVRVSGGDKFSELLAEAVMFEMPEAGMATIEAKLIGPGQSTALERNEQIHVVDYLSKPINSKVYVREDSDHVKCGLRKLNVQMVDSPEEADVIVFSGMSTTGLREIKQRVEGAEWFTHSTSSREASKLYEVSGIANGPCKVELWLSEVERQGEGKRRQNIDVNGKRVLEDLDIYKESGGMFKLLIKESQTEVKDGKVQVWTSSIGREEKTKRRGSNRNSTESEVLGVKVTDSTGKTVAMWGGDKNVTDPSGLVWQKRFPHAQHEIKQLMPLVKNGKRLVLWPECSTSFDRIFGELSGVGAIRNNRGGGRVSEPWMGGWHFTRKHWLLDELPTGDVMDWRYQAGLVYGRDHFYSEPGHESAGSVNFEADDLQAAVGLGVDHKTRLGIAAGSFKYGKGEVVFATFPMLTRALKQEGLAMNHFIALKLLGNAVRGPHANK